jgi:hypothetical protein
MGTLTINGRKVKVDDSFARLSPEDQQRTVEEIAAQMQQSAPPASPGITQLQGKVSDLPSRQPQPPRLLAPDLMTSTAATVNGLVNSVPFLQNISDAVIGTGAQLTGGDYGQTVQGLQAKREQIAQSAPIARTLGELGGAIAIPVGIGATKAGASALGMAADQTLGRNVVNSGLAMAGLSGLNSFSQGNQGGEVLGDMAIGAAGGALAPMAGAAVQKAGSGIANAVTGAAQRRLTNEAIKGAPNATDLKSAASALFESSKAGQAAVRPDVFARFAANLVSKAKSSEIDELLDGEALAAYRKMVTMAQEAMDGGGVSLARLHNLRQIAQDVVGSATKDRTKRFAGDIVNGLDDLITRLKPDQMVGGNKEAANALMEGISTWSRAKKLSVIEEALYQAQNQASGLENGLRIQFRALLKPDKRKQFTKAEIEAIEQIANGTTLSNAARLIGKFGFGSGSASNMLGGTIGFGAGSMTPLGPLGGILAAGVGSGARKLSEKMTEAAARRVGNVVATPNIPIAPQAPNLLAPARLPIEILVRGGAGTSGN